VDDFEEAVSQGGRDVIEAHGDFDITDLDTPDIVDSLGESEDIIGDGVEMMSGIDIFVGEPGVDIEEFGLGGLVDRRHHHTVSVLFHLGVQEILLRGWGEDGMIIGLGDGHGDGWGWDGMVLLLY
jgi:hypothetical protein